MIAKLEKISDRTYRLVAGILYAVLAIFTLYASFAMYTRISMWSFSDLGPLGAITLIGCILLAVGILFSMSELVLGGIIANIALWVLKLIILLRHRIYVIYVPILIYRVLIIALFVFALMTLAGKSTKSFQRIAIYIRLFCFVLALFPLSVPLSFSSLFWEYLCPLIEAIAFISLLMLIYRGSICMPKKTAISQHTKSNNVSSKIETLSNLKDLLDAGTITQEEFDTKKQQLLE